MMTILPDIQILEETETELEDLYRIIIHNDNLTPMDFVVRVLTTIFFLGTPNAMDIMLKAHITGTAYVQTVAKPEGAFTKPIRWRIWRVIPFNFQWSPNNVPPSCIHKRSRI
jgi:ATP-dependent Clp protease adapter protein ClpS